MSAQMTPEVEALLRELDDSLKFLDITLNSINNFNQEDRERKLNKCQVLIKSIRTTKDALQLEAKSLDASARNELMEVMRNKLRELKRLIDMYEHKKSEIDRNVLQTEAHDYSDLGGGGGRGNDMQTTVAAGDALQDQTDAAIGNMAYLVTDAQQVADRTDTKLDAQTAQMQGIGVNLGAVQANAKKSAATVAGIARNAANDLCIQILCGGIAICIITIIILISVN